MRVLQLVGGLSNVSGTTSVVLNTSRHLQDLGCDVTVCYLTDRGFENVPPENPNFTLKSFAASGRWTSWAHSSELALAMPDLIRDHDVVHVHSLWLHLNYVMWKEARRTNTPFVVAPHGTLDLWSLKWHGLRKKLYALLIENRILNQAAAIQATSQSEYDSIVQGNYQPPIHLIRNGVDSEQYTNLPDRAESRAIYGLPADALVLSFLARFHPKKGLDMLLPAFAKATEGTNTHLCIAGSDSGTGYQETLDKLIAECPAKDRVHVIGELQGIPKLQYYSAADVFILPSYSEGLPMVTLEAMAASLPLIVTTGCNLPEVAKYEAGLVVEPTTDGIAEGIDRFVKGEFDLQQLRRNALTLATEEFSWRSVSQELLKLYQSFGASNGS